MVESRRNSAVRYHRRTETSSFGSSGRTSHDSSRFYDSRLYKNQLQENLHVGEDNPLPSEITNRILCKNSEHMDDLPDCSVHLVVTSPPYNVGKQYDEDLTLEEYLSGLGETFKEVRRVLAPGGRLCVNVASVGRRPYIPLHNHIERIVSAEGLLMRGEIIWDKSSSAGTSTAWGSWRSATNPSLRDVHEYILIFSKDSFRRAKGKSTITRDEFLEYTKSVWRFPAASARRIGHPAPFPIELPHRLIQLYSFEGDVILDPFMGSGTTAVAALKCGRRFVGYEKNPDYVSLAMNRLAKPESSTDNEQVPS